MTERSQRRLQELIDRLRLGGHRITPQRVAVLTLLVESEGHPSASQLYERLREHFPTTSPATVYKTLALLKDIGEVLELGFGHDDNRYDGSRPYPHPHLICIRCRSIVDPDVDVERGLVETVARQSGYRIVGHRLDLYGLCPACQARQGHEEARERDPQTAETDAVEGHAPPSGRRYP